MQTAYIGTAQDRVDGPAKVTGTARYAGEYPTPGLLHAAVVSSSIAHGTITAIDQARARTIPGVVEIFTHENRPRAAWFDFQYRDQVAPPGSPFRPLAGPDVAFSGQPIALVVAETFEAATHAADVLRVTYNSTAPVSDLAHALDDAYVPPKKRSGIAPPPKPRGDAAAAFAAAAVKIDRAYSLSREYHNPMEPHATTVVYQDGGKLLIHDKIQGVSATQTYVTNVFGLSKDDVHVVSPYIGGAFGSGLRPQYQLFLAVMASLHLQRSVRVVLTRDQMFTLTYRPETRQTLSLGANAEGQLQSIQQEAIAATSRFEDYQENVVNWSTLLYKCANSTLTYKLAQLDSYTPGDMRAPGAPTGTFAIESAIDELAYALHTDPLTLRLHNYADRDDNDDKPYTSKALRAAYREGAARFGWDRRSAAPRSMRDGNELIGWGMASGIWEAMMQKTTARARLFANGTLEVASATADIGTGTATILTQIAADALGLRMADVTVRIADTDLPKSPIEGGSWTAASAGSAVHAACAALRSKLFAQARAAEASPFADADEEHAVFADGRVALRDDPARSLSLAEIMRAGGANMLEAEAAASRPLSVSEQYSAYTHSAVFVEVRVDEELGSIRVARVVDAVAAGRILNPKTARSQIIGGVIFGIGEALHEEAMIDHTLGRVMNHNLAEYHLTVNADVENIEVIFVDEPDDKVNAMGVKGLGEIGIVGTSAAIANAVYHATGRRIRSLPITIDKLL